MFGIEIQITNQRRDDLRLREEFAEQSIYVQHAQLTGTYIHPCVPWLMAERQREINKINSVRPS